MKHVDVLELPRDAPLHHLDTIDEIAEQRALELVELLGEQIQSDKATELVKIFDKLGAQFAKRRIGDTVHIGDIISEKTTFATRTADWTGIDEVFSIETIYDPVLKRPMSRYTVEMLEANGGKTRMILNSDGSMLGTKETADRTLVLDDEAMDEAMLDLVLRAEVAVGAYEMRKEAAADQGLDPHVYSDVADMDARTKLIALGYKDTRATSLE